MDMLGPVEVRKWLNMAAVWGLLSGESADEG
jgi:hypothetical protein